jgi:hypothetical protein
MTTTTNAGSVETVSYFDKGVIDGEMGTLLNHPFKYRL